jgi:hypothetical protein
MMRRLMPWLPGRERELVLVTLLFCGLLGIAAANRSSPAVLNLVLFTLEIGLPVALGIVAAGLIAGDPVLDLLLSVTRPPTHTLLQRLSALIGYGLLLAVLMLLAAWGWALPVPVSGVQALLIWVAPTALLVGAATAGALLRGKMLDGAASVLAVAGMALLSLTVGADCPSDPRRACYAALATPLMTLLRPLDPLWLANRLLWLAIGIALIVVGLGLVCREERLGTASHVEE